MEKREINEVLIKKIFIVFFAFIGFLTTIKLAAIYFDSNFNPYALPSFCSVSEFVDCDGVAQTIHSQFFGIPLAYWGMGLYIFIVFLTFVDYLKKFKLLSFLEVFKNPFDYISAIGFISFSISMILAGVSVFEIKKVCILCVLTYFLNLFIALTANYKVGFLHCFKQSFTDFIDALKVKKYLIMFLTLSILATGFLAFTTFSCCFTPQVKRYKSIKEFADMKKNPFDTSGNVLGDKDAKVVVSVYSDYVCPICYTENLMIHRAAQELTNVKFVHHNLPLDIECNKYMKQPFHQNACMMAKYAIAAQNQGKLWDLNSDLFEKQPKTEDEILKIAKSIGFDTKKLQEDANSFTTDETIKKDIDDATSQGITGTPTLVINGKIYTGVKPYYELKEILLKAGAVERK